MWSINLTPWYLPQWVENLCPHKNLHTGIYNSFIHNCQNLEAPKCPSVGEWINKLWYIQTMEYYSALKRKELSSHKKTWRKLQCMLLSERSQSEKPTYSIIPTLWYSGKDKTMKTVKRSVLARVCWGEGWKGGAQRLFRAVKVFYVIL